MPAVIPAELQMLPSRTKMPGAAPMGGGAAAVEQAGFGKDVGAGADAGETDAASCHGSHEVERLLALRRDIDPLASGHQQGGDRAVRFESAREHFDTR